MLFPADYFSPEESIAKHTHTRIEVVHRNMWQPCSDEDVSEISDMTSTDFEDNEYEQQASLN
jgi:hypothetical protein